MRKNNQLYALLLLMTITLSMYGMEEDNLSLHQLAKDGKIEELCTCLDNGADIDAKDAEGKTPLMYAVQFGKFATVSTLVINYYVDLEAQGPSGKTALHYTATSDNKSQPAICNLLLNREANPNAQTIDKRTPLHIAALNNREPIVIQLLLGKANTNLKDAGGNTALDYAEDNKNEYITNYLLTRKSASSSESYSSTSRSSRTILFPPERDLSEEEKDAREQRATLQLLEEARQKLKTWIDNNKK